MHPPSRILLLTPDAAAPRAQTLRQALGRAALATLECWSPATLPHLDERDRLRASRLLLERRRARGWDEMEAAAALGRIQTRAFVALAERRFDAVILDAGIAPDPLLDLLEPRPGRPLTPLWLGRSGAFAFGWMDWPPQQPESAIAFSLAGAAACLEDFTSRPAVPLLVRFAGGNDPLRQQVERFHQLLAARCGGLDLPLYSPLFFDQGRLDATRLLEAVHKFLGTETRLPVLCIPQLQREEFCRRLITQGGDWQGAFLAGAEVPVVCLDSACDDARAAATAERFARALARRRG